MRSGSLAPIDGPLKTALFTTGAEATENAVKMARAATGRSTAAVDALPSSPAGVYFADGRSFGNSPFINDAGQRVFYGYTGTARMVVDEDRSVVIGVSYLSCGSNRLPMDDVTWRTGLISSE